MIRERTRESGRFHRAHEGDMTLDWARDGADYTALEFSYIANTMAGFRTIYGRVVRNENGRTYDTYDVGLGRKRLIVGDIGTIASAIQNHIYKVIGRDNIKGGSVSVPELPMMPQMGRERLIEAMAEAAERWLAKELNAEEDESVKLSIERPALKFAEQIYAEEDNKVFSPVFAGEEGKDMVAIGLVNLVVSEGSELYKRWKEFDKKELYLAE